MDPAQTSSRRSSEALASPKSGAARTVSSRTELLWLDCYLSLGSNVQPERHIPAALRLLGALGRCVAVSGLYRTAPIGDVPQQYFHNLALRLRTELSPLFLLERCQALELRLGRVRRGRWGPREIDIDLLLCQPPLVLSHPRLELPHPRLCERAFVLYPLLEVAGSLPEVSKLFLRRAAQAAAGQEIQRLGEVEQAFRPAAARAHGAARGLQPQGER
jgi:2-amino-4-hydroxy-6-hydroxymethyldihydropteridine diphosphokinase